MGKINQLYTLSVINKHENCACGRAMPVLKSLDGRYDDLILTKDGSQLWGNAEPFLVDGDRVTTE